MITKLLGSELSNETSLTFFQFTIFDISLVISVTKDPLRELKTLFQLLNHTNLIQHITKI